MTFNKVTTNRTETNGNSLSLHLSLTHSPVLSTPSFLKNYTKPKSVPQEQDLILSLIPFSKLRDYPK